MREVLEAMQVKQDHLDLEVFLGCLVCLDCQAFLAFLELVGLLALQEKQDLQDLLVPRGSQGEELCISIRTAPMYGTPATIST